MSNEYRGHKIVVIRWTAKNDASAFYRAYKDNYFIAEGNTRDEALTLAKIAIDAQEIQREESQVSDIQEAAEEIANLNRLNAQECKTIDKLSELITELVDVLEHVEDVPWNRVERLIKRAKEATE